MNLQQRTKWQTPRRNLRAGDVVLMMEDTVPRMKWPLARVNSVKVDDDGLVRRVRLDVATKKLDKQGRRDGELSTLERPIQKLVLLMEELV